MRSTREHRTVQPSPTLADPELESALSTDGFVVVDFATADEIAELLRLYAEHPSGISTGYYASIMSTDAAYKAAVNREIQRLFWARFRSFLLDYRPLVGAFMVKHPGAETEVPVHQDWMVVDEDRFRSVNCWIPTCPIDEAVGQMLVLPGSHLYVEGLRGSPSFPNEWTAVNERIRDELMEPVPVQVGQALIYDNRVLHATPPNRSTTTRVVAYINAVPSEATPLHYHRDTDGVVRGFHVTPAFFHQFTIGDHPRGQPFVTIPGYDVAAVDFEDFVRADRQHRSNHRRLHDLRG